jgi:nitroreductase
VPGDHDRFLLFLSPREVLRKAVLDLGDAGETPAHLSGHNQSHIRTAFVGLRFESLEGRGARRPRRLEHRVGSQVWLKPSERPSIHAETEGWMNPRLEPLFARRSIRVWQDRPVTEALIHDLLEVAMAAPSAVRCDPWRFVVVRGRSTLAEIAGVLPNGKMLAQAGVGFVVCGDLGAAHDGQLSYMLQDCSAATENLLLAASMLGLGACWLGVHPREDRIRNLTRILGLPEGVLPVAGVAVGWPGERKPARTRYEAASVHFERW